MKEKIILIQGDETFFINRKVEELITEETIVYDMLESSMEEVKEEVLSFSLFSNSRDVLCKNCSFLSSSSDKDSLKVLGEILKGNIENRLILVLEGKVDERKKEIKELLRLGKVYTFNKLKEYELIKFIGEEFKRNGYKIDISTLNYFHSFVGSNLNIINSEMNKLFLYKDDKNISKEDIAMICSRNLDDNIFDFIDSVVNKNIDKSLSIYDDFILLNEEEIKLITMLADQFRLIYQTKVLSSSGYDESAIIKELGVHPYRIKLAKSSNVSVEDAKKYLMKLYDLDVSIKTGKQDKRAAFKLFLLDFQKKTYI